MCFVLKTELEGLSEGFPCAEFLIVDLWVF